MVLTDRVAPSPNQAAPDGTAKRDSRANSRDATARRDMPGAGAPLHQVPGTGSERGHLVKLRHGDVLDSCTLGRRIMRADCDRTMRGALRQALGVGRKA